MAPPLRASLELDLQDKLSAGLVQIEKQMTRLRDMAKSLGLGDLADGLERLRPGADAIDGVTKGLRTAAKEADITTQAFSKLDQKIVAMRQNAGAAAANDNFGAGLARGLLGFGASAAGTGRSLYGAGRNIVGAGRNFGHATSGVINGAMGAALEGFAVYEPVKAFAERDAHLRQIAVMEGVKSTAMPAELTRLNTLFNEDALATGNSSASVAEAYHDLLGQGLKRSLVEGVLRAHSEAATAYNISPALLGNITGSIVGNLGITGQADAEGALAAVSYATQHGRVKMEDYSRSLPGLSGTAASLGMKGRAGLNTLLAGSELAAKLASDGTQAGYNFDDLLSYITSNREDTVTRKRAGIDLPALLRTGEKHGKSAFDVYIDFFKKNTAGKSPVEQAQFIGKLVGQKQARNGLLAIIQHNAEFEQLRKELAEINALKLKIDFTSVFGSSAVQLQNTSEALSQINQILGKGFLPVVTWVSRRLLDLLDGLRWMTEHMPKTLNVVLATLAGLLAFGAALTVIGTLIPVMAAGWGLLTAVLGSFAAVLLAILSPIGLVVGAVAAIGFAAYDIYENWDRFQGYFEKMWGGVKDTFHDFLKFVKDFLKGDIVSAFDDLKAMGPHLATVFTAIWGAVETTFDDFLKWVDTWTGGLAKRIANGIKAGFHDFASYVAFSPDKLTDAQKDLLGIKDVAQGKQTAGGAAAATAPAAAGRQDSLAISVTAAPGTSVQSVTSTNPNHSVRLPNMGPTTNRP